MGNRDYLITTSPDELEINSEHLISLINERKYSEYLTPAFSRNTWERYLLLYPSFSARVAIERSGSVKLFSEISIIFCLKTTTLLFAAIVGLYDPAICVSLDVLIPFSVI